jgi:hypothetical protein
MTDRTAWDRAVAAWTAASMIREAAEKFGPGDRIEYENTLNNIILEREFGKREGVKAGTAGHDAFSKESLRYEAENEKYWNTYRDPALEAAQLLVSIAAPDFAALRFKIDLINEEELHRFKGTENVFELVEADAIRLAA